MLPGRSQEQKKRRFLSFFSSSSGDDSGDEARATRNSTMTMMTKQPCRVPVIPVCLCPRRASLRVALPFFCHRVSPEGTWYDGFSCYWHVSTQCCPNQMKPFCQMILWLLSSQSLSQFLAFTHNFTQSPETFPLEAYHIVPKSAFRLSGGDKHQ